MSVAGSENLAPRPSAKPLAWALLISLAVHGVAFVAIPGVYFLLVAMSLIAKPPNPAQLKPAQKPPNTVMEELPLTFMEVDPSQVEKDAPKNAKYYAAQNTKAANPDPQVETDKSKIDGKQTHVPKTETVQKPKAVPLQPNFPKPPDAQAAKEAKPKGGPKIGDLAMAKPADKPVEKPADAQVEEVEKHVRFRTVTEALAHKHTIVGEKMKQVGGVNRPRIDASVDAKATLFGSYDALLIQAIQQHWYDLIDKQAGSDWRAGRVVVEFNLNYDGTISDMKVVESSVSGLMTYICQAAIRDPAPFEHWPSDLRRLNASDTRRVTFTFYYD